MSTKPTPVPPSLAETIRSRKSQYCRFADTQDFASWATVFSPSVTAQFCDPQGSVVIENGATYSFDNRDQLTIHVVGSGELHFVDGTDEQGISAIWPVIYHAASHGVSGGWSGTGGGHYYETWGVEDGEWVIKSLKFVRGYWRVQIFDQA
ncbi:hypothetical protein AN9351.2 [Aspergillus nidulans FGSC A4]|uniref:SnoaL-like domain-containing protein n=1 Tax=Emericella nidulans (strain FGSC A4 / ATCC 38163 / CBS 112.46 / NRRL 194 / M139) TaxID=227321 RepID=Q5AQS9_EMENI|nr:hypothetical protein [Aspergillus nidulans FGSC A4]EAA66418.1 hypothetical protein AN9351.2 [Aspergillus nidulans FGSC A4]CBF87456.1 TPA: conserved hypothetical protein [Aspergillus nidulans FGSC A4]|eukprot:XP_682620.1 hypothetical protein AN9351.2 [Aspergillus nidulans FGSC A4]